jgi:hypothetical protein
MPARGRRGSDVLFACDEIDGLASGFARVISCLDVPNQGAEILAIYESCFLGQSNRTNGKTWGSKEYSPRILLGSFWMHHSLFTDRSLQGVIPQPPLSL